MVSLFSVANKGSSEPDYEVGVEQVYVLNGMNECPMDPVTGWQRPLPFQRENRSRSVLKESGN